MSRWLLGWWLLLAGCGGVWLPEEPPTSSAWGEVVTLGQAEQANAPALEVTADRVTAVWVGADNNGVHQDSRTWTRGGLSDPLVLPLPPTHPFQQQLFPAYDGSLHLLWLDAGADGETRLYAAVLSPELSILRGPTVISDRPTLRYSAIASGSGALWVVFSGGLPAEPGLFAVYVDAEGRPRQEVRPAAADADWPILRGDEAGVISLFWRQPSDGQVKRALFSDGVTAEPQAVTTVPLNHGDRLESLAAAGDRTHGYLFWNISRADGQVQTDWASGAANTGGWQAARLGIDAGSEAAFITGFNTGTAAEVGAGERWASWAAPLAGSFDTLPVVAQVGHGLAVIYFRSGQIAGYQEIHPDQTLIGLPAVLSDRDQFLYVSWAHPTSNGAADLRLATLKSAPPSP